MLEHFYEVLCSYEARNVFNPWAKGFIGWEGRLERLKKHLNNPGPRVLLVGEAPGYLGCAVSGVPFTSEAQLCSREMPRQKKTYKQFSGREKPVAEASASIVQNCLADLHLTDTVCWNAFPWHPYKPGTPHQTGRRQISSYL